LLQELFDILYYINSTMATVRFTRPVGMLARSLHQQPFLAPRMVLSQLPRTTVLGIRGYASNQQQGKQILLRDHGVFGMFKAL
jgi:hypothetical protein